MLPRLLLNCVYFPTRDKKYGINRYINHSCAPNLSLEIIRSSVGAQLLASSCTESSASEDESAVLSQSGSRLTVGIFAAQDIEAMTELSFDYGATTGLPTVISESGGNSRSDATDSSSSKGALLKEDDKPSSTADHRVKFTTDSRTKCLCNAATCRGYMPSHSI